MSDTTGLVAALANVQAELTRVKKNKTAQVRSDKGASYSYSYADLGDIQPDVLPLLAAQGLVWVTMPTLTPDGKFVLRYMLSHVSGEKLEGEYPLPLAGSPQAVGSAITYARRYTFTCVLGIVTDDEDDDGQRAQAAHRQREQERPPRQERPADPPRDTQPTQAPERPETEASRLQAAQERAARMSLRVLPVQGDESKEQRIVYLESVMRDRGYDDTVGGWLRLASDYEREAKAQEAGEPDGRHV